MIVHLENTSKVVELVINGVAVPARIWEGVTGNGVLCHAFIARIAVNNNDDDTEFKRDLERTSRLVECEGGFKEARKEPFQFRRGMAGFDIFGESFYDKDN